MEEDTDGRREPPGDTGAGAAEVNGRSAGGSTEAATAARGLGAGGGGGNGYGSRRTRRAPTDGDRPPPQDAPPGEIGRADCGGGWGGHPRSAPAPDLPTDADGSGGGGGDAAADRPRNVQPPSVRESGVSVVAAQPVFRAKKTRRGDFDPTEVDEHYEGKEGEEDEMEQQHDTDDANEVQLVETRAARGRDKRDTRKGKKKKESGASTSGGGSATGSTRSTRRSDLNNRLEQVGVGSRVGIFWPLDGVYYPATIITKHEQWPHTYTYLYDDGEQESFDLSKHQKFQILDDEVPKAALDAIATAGKGGGNQSGDNDSSIAAGRTTRRKAATANSEDDTAEVEEHEEQQGEDWACPTCETTHPYQKKLCQCRSTRESEKGDGKIMLCAIPGCPKRDKGSKYHHMCMRHFAGSKQDGNWNGVAAAVAAAKSEEIPSKKRTRKAPDLYDGQEKTKSTSFDDGDHKSEAKKPKRSKSASRSNNKNELSVDEISNLRSRQPKKKSSSTRASTSRGAREDENSGADSDTEKEDDCEDWICLGCGAKNTPERKRCPPPCCKWKGGYRPAASPGKKKPGKSDDSARPTRKKCSRPKFNKITGEQEEDIDTPAKKKNPYANRKRRDSPRVSSKNQCGKCDACMVDDCGECRNCLDMKKFGGPWKIRQKCMNRPPCEIFSSKSSVKKSKSRALVSTSERTSRAGRPPRAKPVPPAPPAGSIALDPLKPTDDVVVPDPTESCKWSFDESSRVLLAKFNIGSSSSIDPVQKNTLLKMMERDDITVVSEGLVGDLNRTLWDMHYVSNLVGDKPYHKVRRFERELVELFSDKPQSEKDRAEQKIAGGVSTDSVAAASSSVQVEDVARSATGTSTSAGEESSSVDSRPRYHVRHKEVDKNLSMKISDYCKYLDKRSTALQSIAEKRSKKGVDPVNPASREDDLIGRSTNVEGQNSELFTFLTHDGKEETINVVDEVLYLIDYDMVKLLPPLYEDFVNKFKLPDCLPGGQQCMMNSVNINGRPFMGPNFYVTPPASFTHFHQDGHGTVDSGHQCLSGYNEVVMLRRMPEEHKQRALYILNDQAKKKKRSKYDGLYGLPHGDGLGAKPDWPTTDAIEECRRMNYYPSVFVLKPGQFVHINKGRLHAFRKLSPTALPPNDCHRQLRLDTIASDNLGSMERLCVSVAWDWMYKGCTEKGISEEIFSTLHCARLLRGHQLQSLAIPELSVLHTAIQLVAEYEQNNASAETKRGILPFLADNDTSQPDSEAVKEKLKGIAPAMEYIIDRHERAYKAAEQQREIQADQEGCRTTLDIAGLPDASENPESYALDPYGNGDFHCRLCHEELSNIYMHCDGCETLLNKDYNICVSCHGDGRYKEFAQMHPSKATKNSSVNHKGDNQRDIRGNKCPCKNGKACTSCGYCSGCSCKCHQCFTMHMRFSNMDEMIALRERVRNVVGTCSIPKILLGSPDAAASKKAALDLSLAPAPAAASALPSLKGNAVSAIGESKVQNGNQISSREERAKKRNRDRQSSSSIDEEKKEDSAFDGDTVDASVENEMNTRGRQKRSKLEASEESLFEPASNTGGNLKVDEDAMDEEGEPRRLRMTRKRSHNDEELDISNDGAIAKAMQESEYVTGAIQESEYATGRDRVAKSARKASATKLDEDESDEQKFIDVEDGNSATLYRAIGSRHADEETVMSPSPRKRRKAVHSKNENLGDASDGDWERKPPGKKQPDSSEASKRSCIVGACGKESSPETNSMCEEHYANSKATDRKRPRDGRALCPIKECPRLADGARSSGMCRKHHHELQPTLTSSGKEEKNRKKKTDKTFENNSIDGSDESEDDECTKLPAAKLPQVDQAADDNDDEEVEMISRAAASTASAAAAAAAPNHLGRRSSSRASSRASRSWATSASNTPIGEPRNKDDLIKKGAQSFIAPYANAKVLGKLYSARNGLTPSIVLQLLEDHEDSDPSAGMLIDALPKECGLVRDDQNHRNMIRHLYRNFQGEENLLENKTGDKLPVSLQERDICVYTAVLEKGYDFLEHFIPYRSRDEVIKIYRRTEDKGFKHNEDHVAHVKRTIGLIESLEDSLGIEEVEV